jgi:hypothetical protein
MNSWLDDEDSAYWRVLQRCEGVDFVSVQYYNNPPNPVLDPAGAIAHYQHIIDGLFSGDSSKVVFGLCINECQEYNADATTAAKLGESLLELYPSFGGIMNWAINAGDSDGYWSSAVSAALYNS